MKKKGFLLITVMIILVNSLASACPNDSEGSETVDNNTIITSKESKEDPSKCEYIDGRMKYLLDLEAKTASVIANDYQGDIDIPKNVDYEGVTYAVTSLDRCCFSGCSYLLSVTIPDGVTSLGEMCFNSCVRLTKVVIPQSVTSLPYFCFNFCNGLQSVVLPESVVSLGDYCFSRCRNLKSVVLPESISSMGECCFYGCWKLENINLPNHLTELKRDCFMQCNSLLSITIPESVVSLGDYCFYGCPLKSIYASWKMPMDFDISFEINVKDCILYVPKGYRDNYLQANWSGFKRIVEYDVTGINRIASSGDARVISCYGIGGNRLQVPKTKGLNVVRYDDGRVEKKIVH